MNRRANNNNYTDDVRVIHGTAIAFAIIFGALTVAMCYAVFAQPSHGFFGGLKDIMLGLGGNMRYALPLWSLYYFVIAVLAATGRKISALRVLANTLIFMCVFAMVQAFFLQDVRAQTSTILGWMDFIAKSYRTGIGGGAIGAVFSAITFDAIGSGGTLFLLIVLVLALLLITGRFKKIFAGIKNSAHESRQERIADMGDAQFDIPSLDDFSNPEPRQRRTQHRPRAERPAAPVRPAPVQTGRGGDSALRTRLYNEDVEKSARKKKTFDEGGMSRTSRAGRIPAAPEVTDTRADEIFDIDPVTEEPKKPKREIKVKEINLDDVKTNPVEIKNPEPVIEPKPSEEPKLSEEEIEKKLGKLKRVEVHEESNYDYPSLDLLASGGGGEKQDTEADMQKGHTLVETLMSFGIETKLTGIAHGPAVTRFELQPAPGVKVSRITSLADDIALNLAATSVRIEAPIPGKAAVGIEMPNEKVETVHLRDVLESNDAKKHPSRIAVGLGKDNSGRYIIADIAKMPHVLIAGQTGSGKSVCINSIIASILYRATPDEVKMILIDPKVVELSVYNDIPHLIAPVVTDPKKAASALDWAVVEMTARYKKFSEKGVRNMKGYNAALSEGEEKMPHIVIIVDELADLMMVCPGEVEDSICRLAQLARAAGMHLVIATQRPSVNVITGIIKANIPTRIAFLVASQVDSRTIIDHGGAEKLLGYGDMLFSPSGQKPVRVQGSWVSDDEISAVVDYIKSKNEPDYNEDIQHHIENATKSDAEKEDDESAESDPRLPEAIEIVLELGQASTSMLQRKMRMGYARAGRLIDEMEKRGVVSPADGAKPRQVLITREQYERMFEE